MRIMLSLSEEMHQALEEERNHLMLKNIQDVIRMILSEHFNSRSQGNSKTNPISGEESRRCEEVQIQDSLAVFHPFIMIAHDLGESSDIYGVVNMFDLLLARVGAVFNYNFQSSMSNVQRENLIVFMRDDNPTNTRMRFVLGGLRGLINVDGITDLEPSLKVVKDIILAHIAQRASEV